MQPFPASARAVSRAKLVEIQQGKKWVYRFQRELGCGGCDDLQSDERKYAVEEAELGEARKAVY